MTEQLFAGYADVCVPPIGSMDADPVAEMPSASSAINFPGQYDEIVVRDDAHLDNCSLPC